MLNLADKYIHFSERVCILKKIMALTGNNILLSGENWFSVCFSRVGDYFLRGFPIFIFSHKQLGTMRQTLTMAAKRQSMILTRLCEQMAA